MHISMMSQTIAYIGRCSDMAFIQVSQGAGTDFANVSDEYSGYCAISAQVQILFETFGYINMASYLFLLRHSVTNATANLTCLRIKL